jgi:hypothetical protein
MKSIRHFAPQGRFHFSNTGYRVEKLVTQVLEGDVGVGLGGSDVGVAGGVVQTIYSYIY